MNNNPHIEGNEKDQVDPRLERMEELRNEFVALGFDIHWKTDPGGITNLCMAAIGVSMDATRAICAELLKKTKPQLPRHGQRILRGWHNDCRV